MNSSRTGLIVGAVVLGVVFVVGVALLLLASGASPAPAPNASASASPTSTSGTPTAAPDAKAVEESQDDTSLNLTVTGCEGCQVTARATQGGADPNPQSATVSEGTVQFDLPTASTLGLVLSIRGEKDGIDDGDDQLVILQAGDTTPGTPQSESQVKAASEGTYCWAGTLLEVATIRISVAGDSQEPTMAWADPALPTVGESVNLKKGTASVPSNPGCASA